MEQNDYYSYQLKLIEELFYITYSIKTILAPEDLPEPEKLEAFLVNREQVCQSLYNIKLRTHENLTEKELQQKQQTNKILAKIIKMNDEIVAKLLLKKQEITAKFKNNQLVNNAIKGYRSTLVVQKYNFEQKI